MFYIQWESVRGILDSLEVENINVAEQVIKEMIIETGESLLNLKVVDSFNSQYEPFIKLERRN